MARYVLFLDDGGVMNDNLLRGHQWQRLVGEYFAPRLGGTAERWASSNGLLVEGLFHADNWARRLSATRDYGDYDRRYQLDWLCGMCRMVGVEPPANEDDIVAMAHQATVWITARVRSAYPGTVEAIRTLHSRGYILNTASGESSPELEGYLTGMGVRDYFQHLYGPDLVGTFKDGPEYYRRIFQDAGIDPALAIVLDDKLAPLSWAAEVGAQTIQVASGAVTDKAVRRIPSLAALPELLAHREY